MAGITAESSDGLSNTLGAPETKATDAESLREENKQLRELVIHLSKLVLTDIVVRR
jgi:hypothetical protein